MDAALDDLRVIELGSGEGPALCGRFLAELGAEVIKVEPPGGDPLRRVPPFWGESSYLFEMLAAGKRSVVLDPGVEADATALRVLLAGADVLLEGEGAPGTWTRGLDDALAAVANHRLIRCSLSALGREGPRGGRPGADIIAQAMGGMMMVNGFEHEPPTKTGAAIADFAAALCAALGVLAALYHRDATGLGQRVDISGQDCVVFINASLLPNLYLTGKALPRQGNRHAMLVPYNAYPTADGWVIICTGNDEQWRRLCHAIGNEPLAADERFARARDRVARVDEVDAFVGAWTKERPVAEVVAALTAADIPASAVQTVPDLLADPQFHGRGMVVAVPHAAGPLMIPGSAFKMSRTPGLVPGVAPACGEHQSAILAPRPRPAERQEAPADAGGAGPLRGLKVLELTHFAAGPTAARLLADLGAEVVKVEPPGRGDGARHLPPFVDGLSYTFQMLNHGKLGLTLDLRRQEGSAILCDLARDADVLVENYSVGVMDKLGVGANTLSALNPRLVYCSLAGFGQTGPDRDRPAFDQVVQARSGLMSLSGWPSGPPHRAGTAALDYLGPFAGVAAVLAALHYRHRRGVGQRVDIAMYDVGGLLTYSAWPAYFAEGRHPRRHGNRSPVAAPYNAYAARDGMLVIGVTTDEQWRGLRRAMGERGVSFLAQCETLIERLQWQEEIDTAVARWVAGQRVEEAVAACLECGVPAGPVCDLAAVVNDRHLAYREMLVEIRHPRAGAIMVTGSPVKLSLTPARVRGPAPDLGEHSAALLASRLGYQAAEIARLRSEGVL